MEVIPIAERLCDFCNDVLTDESHTVLKSFVLTDWGVICFECWDNKIKHYEEFEIIKAYAKAEVIQDHWARQPMVLDFFLMSPRRRQMEGDVNG